MTDNDEQVPKITLKFKTTQATHELELPEDVTVEKAKEALAQKLNHPKERLTLIFSGKILKDPDTIASYGIKDGMAVHMVLRAGSSGTSTGATATPAPTAAPSNPATTQASSMGDLLGNPSLINQAQQLMNNPEVLREIMNQPMMQQMLSNPEIIRSMFSSNPQIQQIIQRNPELGHILNDPDVIRQTMDMIRNPTAFNEMMRGHDQAIRNLQGLPGGEAALQRLYQEVQEPLLNSTIGSNNPYASSNPNSEQDSATSRSQRAGVENAEALPNPWGSGSAGSEQQRATGGSGQAAANPLAGIMAGAGNMGNMFSPEMLSNAMRSLGNRPDILNSLGGSMGNMLGNVNPAVFLNPRVMQAMTQISQATQVLMQEAPELLNMFQQGGRNPASGAPPSSEAATNPPPTSGASNMGGLMDFASMLQQMNIAGAGGGAAPTAQLQPPEERFRSQLEQLVTMGFNDREANIRALTASFGDINAAIEHLISGNNGPAS